MSSYNPNIPQPTDKLKNSQPQILNNFSSANTSFGVNHFAFDNATLNNGKHNFVELVERTVIPPGLVTGEETLYSKVVSAEGQMFFTRGSSAVEIQMTGPGDPIVSQNGKTFLPGGILMQWGTVLNVVDGTTVTFPVAFTTVYVAVATGQSASSQASYLSIRTGTITVAGFTFEASGSDAFSSADWIAIGK